LRLCFLSFSKVMNQDLHKKWEKLDGEKKLSIWVYTLKRNKI
jgi:CRISPR/Cas system-associated endoribonuclease Cas2